ncbi:MAG: TadE/TadG family type IV pilus assembly protein [Bauldia sp.]
MSFTTAPRRTGKGRGLSFKRLRHDESGATAVEFGIVALPFFALMFAILETALMFFADQALETAVANAARLIRTGQAQQQGFNANDFKDEICEQVMSLFGCDADLVFDVRTYPTFEAIDLTKPVDDDGNLAPGDFIYEPGNGGDIVTVRAFYEWPSFTGVLGFSLANMPNGSHLLAAAAAFRNEPFPW